jgi:hypothetical protein
MVGWHTAIPVLEPNPADMLEEHRTNHSDRVRRNPAESGRDWRESGAHYTGRGKRSGLDLGRKGLWLFRVRDGQVTKLVRYWDRERGRAPTSASHRTAAPSSAAYSDRPAARNASP